MDSQLVHTGSDPATDFFLRVTDEIWQVGLRAGERMKYTRTSRWVLSNWWGAFIYAIFGCVSREIEDAAGLVEAYGLIVLKMPFLFLGSTLTLEPIFSLVPWKTRELDFDPGHWDGPKTIINLSVVRGRAALQPRCDVLRSKIPSFNRQ